MDLGSLPAPLRKPDETFSSRSLEVLREMVVSGALQPGQRLNEAELARRLGISRGPLREAIQRLTSEGLLIGVSSRGSFVRMIDTATLSELYEVRIALETHAVLLVTRAADPKTIEALRELMAETRGLLSADSRHAFPRDLDFHERIHEATGNSALQQSTIEVHRQLSLVRSRSAYQVDRAPEAYAEHEQILEDLAAGRAEAAASAMERHLRLSLASTLRLIGADDPGQARAESPGERTTQR